MFGEALGRAKTRNHSMPGDRTEAHAHHGGRSAAAEDVQMHDGMSGGLEAGGECNSRTGEVCKCSRKVRLRRKTTFCCT